MNPIKRFKTPTRQRGFTLIELMIAMAILAIGILATMAMQITAMSGYNSARDATMATELAKTVEQVIQAEARDWKVGESMASTSDAYDDGVNYFNTAVGGNHWNRVHDEPITRRRSSDDVDDAPARFCVYVAGDEMEANIARINIAVVYPASRGQFEERDSCPDLGRDELDTINREDLELDGLRAVHLTTAVAASPAD